jgi:hypothetical protein
MLGALELIATNPHNALGRDRRRRQVPADRGERVQSLHGRIGETGRMGPQRATAIAEDAAATEAKTIEAATGRLIAALDALEAAAERRRDSDRGGQSLAAQVQALGADRSKLAAELDAETARARRLVAGNRDIARRLDLAMESIRSVLEARDR